MSFPVYGASRRGGTNGARAIPSSHRSRQATAGGTRRSSPNNTPYGWQTDMIRPRRTVNQVWSLAEPSAAARVASSSPEAAQSRQPSRPARTDTTSANGAAAAVGSVPESSRNTPTVEVALRMLFDALVPIKSRCEGWQQKFQKPATAIDWYAGETLDVVWRSMLADIDEAELFEAESRRLKKTLASLKLARKMSRSGNFNDRSSTKQHRELCERRHRIAWKAERHCNDLLELIPRVLKEVSVCRLFLDEASDLVEMLDPKEHPSLYGDQEDQSEEINSHHDDGQWEEQDHVKDNDQLEHADQYRVDDQPENEHFPIDEDLPNDEDMDKNAERSGDEEQSKYEEHRNDMAQSKAENQSRNEEQSKEKGQPNGEERRKAEGQPTSEVQPTPEVTPAPVDPLLQDAQPTQEIQPLQEVQPIEDLQPIGDLEPTKPTENVQSTEEVQPVEEDQPIGNGEMPKDENLPENLSREDASESEDFVLACTGCEGDTADDPENNTGWGW